MAIETIPATPVKKARRSRKAASENVVSLQEARFAKLAEQRKAQHDDQVLTDRNGDTRRLLWVSKRESDLLSTIYEGYTDAAVEMVKAMMKRA